MGRAMVLGTVMVEASVVQASVELASVLVDTAP